MKIAVIKSNFGNRNSIFWQNISNLDSVDYHYFTDSNDIVSKNNLIGNGVHVHTVNYNNCLLDTPVGTHKFRTRRQAKIYKILPDLFAPSYDYYIWMDAYFEIKSHPVDIIQNSGLIESNSNFAFFRHGERDCIYTEAELIKKINYDDRSTVDMQMMTYRSAFSYPENNGLYECTCYVFKNTEKSKHIRVEWLNHINRFSSRDQLSLPFILHSFNESPVVLAGRILPGRETDNPYFVSGGNR